jgi:uncharacterized protein (DUF1330 family)
MSDIFVDPSREHFDAFKALPRDVPIHMLNLLRFNEHAAYPPDHLNANKGWSGAEAYDEYGKASGPVFRSVGGNIIWRGRMETMVIGPDDKNWEMAFIAAYPNSAAFLKMISDPDYQKAVVNRQAAVLTSQLIRFAPLSGDDAGFG